ncbi:MAG: hypothetical protein R2783_09470 [Gelidibacter sp.]
MNLLQKHTAKFCVPLLFVSMVLCSTNHTYAQMEYTTITKNINPEAQNLYHDLSPQGDTLYLKAESIFYKVTFLNSQDRKVYKFNPPVLETKISLHDIIVGDYTVLVYKKDRIIVFHISRLLEIEKPSELIASKGFSISEEQPISEIGIAKIPQKEMPTAEIVMNEIKNDDTLELNSDAMKVAINDMEQNDVMPNFSNKPKVYNLTDLNRDGVQTREEYRRSNLRPNGKPYY